MGAALAALTDDDLDTLNGIVEAGMTTMRGFKVETIAGVRKDFAVAIRRDLKPFLDRSPPTDGMDHAHKVAAWHRYKRLSILLDELSRLVMANVDAPAGELAAADIARIKSRVDMAIARLPSS